VQRTIKQVRVNATDQPSGARKNALDRGRPHTSKNVQCKIKQVRVNATDQPSGARNHRGDTSNARITAVNARSDATASAKSITTTNSTEL
jgi:hypothetical protein